MCLGAQTKPFYKQHRLVPYVGNDFLFATLDPLGNVPFQFQQCLHGWCDSTMNQTKGRCQETSSFTIVHLLHRSVHVQLHGATQCTLDRGLEPKDSCQRKTIQ